MPTTPNPSQDQLFIGSSSRFHHSLAVLFPEHVLSITVVIQREACDKSRDRLVSELRVPIRRRKRKVSSRDTSADGMVLSSNQIFQLEQIFLSKHISLLKQISR
ncbi:uncharacterized protein YALI1_D01713g [Yarrowia lipolytica]|uniref:Uncharacterized protein n=1 Tax=Yarrowia lipolytica TaxID=4952 RepID=A0A1D8NCR8_YARLL|nr:hypothetical protein YALI1_D01713g [Yarrowia lipolytica]